MTRAISTLNLDKTGREPNNLSSFEKVDLVPAPLGVKIGILEHGGFYENNLKVYDKDYNVLKRNYDYKLGYYHKKLSLSFGLDVFSCIVILNESITDEIYVTAQMVGSDLAYSFTVIEDYYLHLDNKRLDGETKDNITDTEYIGNEPVYCPGELARRRWKLDTFQPFNNEIYELAKRATGQIADLEEEFREYIRNAKDRFVGGIDEIMTDHINDLDNPHEEDRNTFGLGLVENYRVATLEETLEGERNDLYLTPYLTWKYLETYSKDDLDDHIYDYNNPHETTIEHINAVENSVITTDVEKKYYVDEVVENSTRGYYKSDKTYSQIVNEFRSNLPAGNFTSGKINLNRMGSGTPNSNNILASNSLRWTDWTNFVQSYIATPGDIWNAYPTSNWVEVATADRHIRTSSTWRSKPYGSMVMAPGLVYMYMVGGWTSGSLQPWERREEGVIVLGLYKTYSGGWIVNIGS